MESEILLGPVEFAVWQTMTRYVAVAIIVRLVYLAVFVRRPGFLLAVELDPASAIASFLRFATRRPSAIRNISELLLAASLLLLALVGVFVNFALSTAFSAYQQNRQVRVVWVRPTNATARPWVPLEQYGQAAPRHAANTILQALIKDKLGNETVWVETVGTLTEAEIMSMQFDNQCSGGDGGAGGEASTRAAGDLDPAVINGTGLVAVRMDTDASQHGTAMLGHKTRLYTVDWSDGASRSTMLLPVPITRLAESAGRLDATTPATVELRRYGVAAVGAFMNSYHMECGLSPTDVDEWIKARTSAPLSLKGLYSVAPDLDPSAARNTSSESRPSRPSMLQYMDYTQVSTMGRQGQESTAGTVTAVLASLDPERASHGEFEFVTFGSLTATTKTSVKVASLVTVSEALVAAGKFSSNRLTTQIALTSINQTCSPSPDAVGSFKVGATIGPTDQVSASGYTVASSRRPFAWAARDAGSGASLCRLDVTGLASTRLIDSNGTQSAATDVRQTMEYLTGAQVCRVVVRNFKSPTDLSSTGSTAMARRGDFVVAAQVVNHHVNYRVRCMEPSVMAGAVEQMQLDPASRTEPRPILTMGLLSRWWGSDSVADNGFADDSRTGWVQIRMDVANFGGLVADGSASYPSWTDPDGPQQYSMNAVQVDKWEVVGSLALAVVLVALGFSRRLPMLYDTVVMQLFLYPHLRRVHDQTRKSLTTAPSVLFEPFYPTSTGHVGRHMLVENLTFKATLVLIEYPAGMDPAAVMSAPRSVDEHPAVAFDVQFVHANQRQVWTPFGSLPLPHRNASSLRPWTSFAHWMASWMHRRPPARAFPRVEAQRGFRRTFGWCGEDGVESTPLSYSPWPADSAVAWGTKDEMALVSPRLTATTMTRPDLYPSVMPVVLLVSNNYSAIKKRMHERLEELNSSAGTRSSILWSNVEVNPSCR
ncbi:hypothetical protein AMAG_12279 [Allomyces macrogynus ATCC 38327]|uniref:Uncharacterized protein n=1 Tax=Allomyces macrogynus (strain ATCC 38327) TaxID=578462 RepID=A0A0L0SXB9_ALLM3|nr:hypothetical protein AMAG_12279 [Allomyces macrogynus ATCC 38327]|eukprot:KNE67208.1 hypothetical protein AMAG_12279 [Allomyces macrogynus ATCC 38327]